MKSEIYSCLRMLESFNKNTTSIFNTKRVDSARKLRKQYRNIHKILLEHLDENQIKFIPTIESGIIGGSIPHQIGLVQELIVASDIAISYLRSLDMDLDKELKLKKKEITKKEKELELREEEIKYTRELLKKSLEAIKGFPELQRSKIVEEIKKSHREIEKHSKKS